MSDPQPLPSSPRRRRDTSAERASSHNQKQPTPRFLAVFESPAELHTRRLADVLKVKESRHPATRTSMSFLQASQPGHAETRVFHRLGVAALDLTPDEKESVERIDGVRVVPNEERHLPPIFEVMGDGEEPQTDNHSYLRGFQDGIEFALTTMSDGGTRAGGGHRDPNALAAGPGTNWCLGMIGIDTHSRQWTGRDITIAVLDTGIDENHPDFVDRIHASECFVPGAVVDDGNGHGTHCAGVVAGPMAGRGRMPHGVAPDANLLVGKVLSDAGRGMDDGILSGIDWALDLGATAVSMSFGVARRVGEGFPAQYEAVAKTLLAQGCVLVAAAGNESMVPYRRSPVGNPAACPSIMAIAACDRGRRAAAFSCRGMDTIGQLDLTAPGVAVYSTWRGGGYKLLSGTSMATPHVAGMAALHAERGGTGMRGQTLWDSLIAKALPLGPAADFGRGLVQL